MNEPNEHDAKKVTLTSSKIPYQAMRDAIGPKPPPHYIGPMYDEGGFMSPEALIAVVIANSIRAQAVNNCSSPFFTSGTPA